MSRRTAWLVAASVAAVALGAAAVGAVALVVRAGGASRPGEVFSGGGYLALDLRGDMPEGPAPDRELLRARPPSLRALVEASTARRTTVASRGCCSAWAPVSTGWARVQELRDAIVRFAPRASRPTRTSSWPATRSTTWPRPAPRSTPSPTAMLDVSGLAAEVTFFRGTLDKLGVEAQFEGVGKYKNAPNQFTERGFTAPHREQMEALLDSCSTPTSPAIAEGRRLEPQTVARADRQRARTSRPRRRTRASWTSCSTATSWSSACPAARGSCRRPTCKSARGGAFDRRPKLALVYAVGDIMPGESQQGPFGNVAGSDTVIQGLRTGARGQLGARDHPARRQPRRLGHRLGRDLARGAAGPPREARRGVDGRLRRLGRLLHRDGRRRSWSRSPATITGSIGVFGGQVQPARALRQARASARRS